MKNTKKWVKEGLVFKPDPKSSWMYKYAWVPTAFNLYDDTYRVFFSGRNIDNFSTTGYFDVSLKDPSKIISVSEQPVLGLGELGLFDDSLAVGCSVVEVDGLLYLYYVGWMQGKRVRYYPSVGLAISSDRGLSFKKYSRAPLIGRSDADPYGMASPFVMCDEGIWKMWYASYRKWELRGEESWPRYEIRYAESADGISWNLRNVTCLGSSGEEAVARPWVIKNNEKYLMWYAYRQNFEKYRIGYAESVDGIVWDIKNEEVGIDVSESGWDSEMLEYPCVIEHKNTRYMFYNGNNFGEHGIGLAVYK